MDVKKYRPRCVVLGLDGLPYSLAQKLSQTDRFPNLRKIALSSGSQPIHSELPDLSPVNWTSFYTASGPEHHGIFGFTAINPINYRLSISNYSMVKCPTIFESLNLSNRICKVINLPNTYPAKPLKGMLISGFVSVDLQNAVYPPFLYPRLKDENYKLEADTRKGRNDPDLLFSELNKTLTSRRRALELFWPDLEWDLFVLVLTETDRLGHFFFPSIIDSKDPFHSLCLDLLGHWDKVIGEFLERYQALPEPKRLLVLADHGFTSLTTEVDLNVWLEQSGLLQMQYLPSNEWDSSCIGSKTKAFALDPGRIYLHRASRFGRGCLSEEEALTLRGELICELKKLTYNQEPVFEDIVCGQDLYPGADSPQCPDLVCIPRPGIDLKAKFDRHEIFGYFGRTGTHTYKDAMFFDSQQKQICSVKEVGSEVLNFFKYQDKGLIESI